MSLHWHCLLLFGGVDVGHELESGKSLAFVVASGPK